MQVYHTIKSLKKNLIELSKKNTIGLVPTMGALHKGHLSLLKQANKENNITVVTIFVNPTQFDKKEDLVNYPRDTKNDLQLLESNNCNIVFIPEVSEIYTEDIISEKFEFDGLELEMEGKHRIGHFDGVGTIVKKLLEIVEPDKAYFGEKDFQQLQIIKKLVNKYAIPVEIVGCPIFREKDGLAMSSRNTRLTQKQREEAPFIYKTLKKAQSLFKEQSIASVKKWVENEFNSNDILQLEYFEITDVNTLKPANRKRKSNKYRGFLAVYADNIRLIDNIALN